MIEHFELAQSSRSSLPKPECCDLCPNGRLINLRISQPTELPSVAGCTEFDPPKFIRLSSELFPDLKGPHLMVFSNICAHPSLEFFVSTGTNQWVRTSVTSDTGAERLCSPTLIEEDRHKLMSIHSNVLPRDSYWTKLRAVRVDASKRVHFPSSILEQAFQERKTLMTKFCEWRNCGEECDIGLRGVHKSGDEKVEELQRGRSICFKKEERNTEKLIWKIQPADVEEVRIISKVGADGDVWLVKWKGGTFARKDRRGASNSQAADTELAVLERLSHPHLVYGFGESSRGELRASLFMEFMQSNLFSFAIKNGQGGTSKIKRPFSRGDSLDILLQIADAMEYMHANGFVHGDLTPRNILISDVEIFGNARHFLAKVADFGDTRIISNDGKDSKPSGFGTNSYAAPELLKWRTNRAVTFRSLSKIDVYGFGCVAYEVLTGYAVYDGQLHPGDIGRIISGDLKPSDHQVWKTLIKEYRYPLDLVELLESCWELEPMNRPSFSQIFLELKKCKPNFVRSLEKAASDFWKFMAKCTCALICIFLYLGARFVLESPRLSSAAIFVTLILGAMMIYEMFLRKDFQFVVQSQL